jgi:hypothetical protein
MGTEPADRCERGSFTIVCQLFISLGTRAYSFGHDSLHVTYFERQRYCIVHLKCHTKKIGHPDEPWIGDRLHNSVGTFMLVQVFSHKTAILGTRPEPNQRIF